MDGDPSVTARQAASGADLAALTRKTRAARDWKFAWPQGAMPERERPLLSFTCVSRRK